MGQFLTRHSIFGLGWIGSGIEFRSDELMVALRNKVKYLALIHRRYELGCFVETSETPEQLHEENIQVILQDFPNLEILTLVNRQNYPEDSQDVVFVENMEGLCIWQYRKWDCNYKNDPDWDSQALNIRVLETTMQNSNRELPEINRRIIADRKTAKRLIEIVGGEERLPILQTLDGLWLHRLQHMEDPGILSLSHEM